MSRATKAEGLKLTNFTHDMIKVNQNALKEQERLRKDKLFVCNHGILKIEGFKATMVNVRSWNAHLKHFVSDPYLLSKCCLCVFIETNNNNQDSITNYNIQWEEVHQSTGHGLALCYNKDIIKVGKQYEILTNIEAMAHEVDVNNDFKIILLIVYRKPGAVHNFIDLLKEQIRSLPRSMRIIILGDFNLDQRDINMVHLFDTLVDEFSLVQRSQFTTRRRGILDLIFDNKKDSEDADILPVPYTDHFISLFSL